jgi:hypothetical protein
MGVHSVVILHPAVFSPSIRCRVWRAICSSPCEAKTRTEQRDAEALMGSAAERLCTSSKPTPIHDKPPLIRRALSRCFLQRLR